MTFEHTEVADAFATYLDTGVGNHDWERWSSLFTEDALYEEHHLGTMRGRQAIRDFIVNTMGDYQAMSLWPEWYDVDGDLVSLYIWNNLPDPGTGKRYGFPNTTVLRYAGDGLWDWEADFYDPADAERVWTEWFNDGGRNETPADHTLQGVADWAPEPSAEMFPREEVEQEFEAYRERGRIAVATGDWNQWADQFTDDARYLEHHYGRFNGQDAIREWITSTMKPFPTMEFPVSHTVIAGNRISAVIPNVLPDPTGGDAYFAFDCNTVLHYAGHGKWSYEEDVYNPRKAGKVVKRWIEAGGEIPT